MVHRLLPFLVLILAIPVRAAGTAPAPAARFDSGGQALKIPFDDDFGLVFVKVRVNDSRTAWFLLDSGFDANILSTGLAKSLGVALADVQRIPQPGGEIEMGRAAGLVFGLPGVTLVNQTAQTAPLAPLEPFVGRSLDGILGHEFIRQLVVEIDYAAAVLNLYDPAGWQYDGGGEILPVTITGAQPFVPGQVLLAGRKPVAGRFKLDTGSLDTIGFNRNFLSAHRLPEVGRPRREEPGLAVGGETRGVRFRVDGFRLGSRVLKGLPVGGTLDSKGFEDRSDAGTIGAGVLGRFRLVLDYARRRAILEPNARFAEPFPFDMSGAWVTAGGPDWQDFRVHRVLPGTPAAEAGLREGDVILAVDGRLAETLTLALVRELLQGPDGQARRLRIRRGDGELTVDLKLRKLI